MKHKFGNISLRNIAFMANTYNYFKDIESYCKNRYLMPIYLHVSTKTFATFKSFRQTNFATIILQESRLQNV